MGKCVNKFNNKNRNKLLGKAQSLNVVKILNKIDLKD